MMWYVVVCGGMWWYGVGRVDRPSQTARKPLGEKRASIGKSDVRQFPHSSRNGPNATFYKTHQNPSSRRHFYQFRKRF